MTRTSSSKLDVLPFEAGWRPPIKKGKSRMIPSLVITFRETLEAALVVGIVLSFLSRTRQQQYRTAVYVGVFAGIVGSLLGAVLFTALAGGFTGRAEEIFEGVTMLVGALLLTTMILWMLKQRHIAKELESKVATEVAQANRIGLFSLVFLAVLREGVETVIFLGAASAASTSNNVLGALAGISGAALLGYAMFVGSREDRHKDVLQRHQRLAHSLRCWAGGSRRARITGSARDTHDDRTRVGHKPARECRR